MQVHLVPALGQPNQTASCTISRSSGIKAGPTSRGRPTGLPTSHAGLCGRRTHPGTARRARTPPSGIRPRRSSSWADRMTKLRWVRADKALTFSITRVGRTQRPNTGRAHARNGAGRACGQDLHEWVIKPQLRTISGVSGVSAWSGQTPIARRAGGVTHPGGVQ